MSLSLLLAAAFWILIHLGLAGTPIRYALIGRLGETGWRGLFSLLSAAGIVWLAVAYRGATTPETFYGLWVTETWMLWLPALFMLPATQLFVGSLTVRNPTLVGQEKALAAAEPARGWLRVTRHPMLWAFALWAASHLVANGDLGSLLLFGSILIVALAGMASIDRKRAQADPAGWAGYAAVTSAVPFAAIAAGRNRFVFAEIGAWRVALGLALWAGLIVLHPLVFGAEALPG